MTHCGVGIRKPQGTEKEIKASRWQIMQDMFSNGVWRSLVEGKKKLKEIWEPTNCKPKFTFLYMAF